MIHTCSPMRVVKLGATLFILFERYSLSSERYLTRPITRVANLCILMRSIGLISIPTGRERERERERDPALKLYSISHNNYTSTCITKNVHVALQCTVTHHYIWCPPIDTRAASTIDWALTESINISSTPSILSSPNPFLSPM